MMSSKNAEIGFGCGHHNHGTGARLWKEYFNHHRILSQIYSIDFSPGKEVTCITDFLSKYPLGTVIDGFFVGDQSNKEFLESVVSKTGGNFDIIIDDGGHLYHQILPSFEVLWKHVNKGGYYIVEDLWVQGNSTGFVKHITGFVDQLASNRRDQASWPAVYPDDLLGVNCKIFILLTKKSKKMNEFFEI